MATVVLPAVEESAYKRLETRLKIVEGLGDRTAGKRHEHGLGVREVTALSPGSPHLAACALPEIREPATDVAPTNHCDLHFAPSPLQIEIGYSARGHPADVYILALTRFRGLIRVER